MFRTFDTDRNGFIDFKEFLLSIDVTSSGTPDEKLEWAFRFFLLFFSGIPRPEKQEPTYFHIVDQNFI